MLATFQVIHLWELVFCAASCSQANRLFKVKGILNEAEIAVFSGGQLNSCSGTAGSARTGRSSGKFYGSNLLWRSEMPASEGLSVRSVGNTRNSLGKLLNSLLSKCWCFTPTLLQSSLKGKILNTSVFCDHCMIHFRNTLWFLIAALLGTCCASVSLRAARETWNAAHCEDEDTLQS